MKAQGSAGPAHGRAGALDWTSLRHFLELARTGSLSRAARARRGPQHGRAPRVGARGGARAAALRARAAVDAHSRRRRARRARLACRGGRARGPARGRARPRAGRHGAAHHRDAPLRAPPRAGASGARRAPPRRAARDRGGPAAVRPHEARGRSRAQDGPAARRGARHAQALRRGVPALRLARLPRRPPAGGRPPARRLRHVRRQPRQRAAGALARVAFRCNSTASLVAAARAGVAVLPCFVADGDRELVALDAGPSP